MEYTQEDLNQLNKAIKSGRFTVEYDGQKVTYRSLDELIRARNLIKSELAETYRRGASIASFVRG
ncbi:phage head-tail joining protein [Undibacterium sp. CY21W]|uniref:phage head-tail joining protein n=1 Tax=Undibacterium sp. CY21W TaxID=2762293 RepID=UPI00164AE853|nr:hypothetical protein [Undibacterium sp. CY21W]MBC3927782.1 hypothetical protein [Undibacterium sp. CY21W]